MGISINLYRVDKAENIDDLKNLEEQLKISEDTKVDLYKMTEDLAIIFTNNTNPFEDNRAITYKMLYGNQARKTVDRGEIGGFLPSTEILGITTWIKQNQVNTFLGFSKMYDGLSIEAKKQLDEMGCPTKAELFNAYVRPLVTLYFTALQYHNSILFVGQ